MLYLFTAAHCFQNKAVAVKTSPVDILALVGKLNLDIDDEFGSKPSVVDDIILHPDWDFNHEKYDADISVVVMIELVEFNRHIQPICLPSASNNTDHYPTGTGVIAAWGQSANSGANHYDSTLNQLYQPIVSAHYCYTTFPDLAEAAPARAFCGGFVNQSKSACGGDSGGGFYFEDKSSSTWTVKGIVSGGLQSIDGFSCNVNAFTVYTNVARFVDWVENLQQKTKEVEWKFIDFKCVDREGFR